MKEFPGRVIPEERMKEKLVHPEKTGGNGVPKRGNSMDKGRRAWNRRADSCLVSALGWSMCGGVARNEAGESRTRSHSLMCLAKFGLILEGNPEALDYFRQATWHGKRWFLC